jgi:hypothetical protein
VVWKVVRGDMYGCEQHLQYGSCSERLKGRPSW